MGLVDLMTVVLGYCPKILFRMLIIIDGGKKPAAEFSAAGFEKRGKY